MSVKVRFSVKVIARIKLRVRVKLWVKIKTRVRVKVKVRVKIRQRVRVGHRVRVTPSLKQESGYGSQDKVKARVAKPDFSILPIMCKRLVVELRNIDSRFKDAEC